jgi:hypothetical protein
MFDNLELLPFIMQWLTSLFNQFLISLFKNYLNRDKAARACSKKRCSESRQYQLRVKRLKR